MFWECTKPVFAFSLSLFGVFVLRCACRRRFVFTICLRVVSCKSCQDNLVVRLMVRRSRLASRPGVLGVGAGQPGAAVPCDCWDLSQPVMICSQLACVVRA